MSSRSSNGQHLDTGRGWRPRAREGLALLAPAAGVVGTVNVPNTTGTAKVALVAGIVVATAGASLLALIKESRIARMTAKAIAAKTALQTMLAAKQPLLAQLRELCATVSLEEANARLQALQKMAMQLAVSQCGNEIFDSAKIRSAFYLLKDSPGSKEPFLELDGDHVGRPSERAPRPRFEPTDGKVHRRVIAIAHGNNIVRINDTNEATAEEFEKTTDCIYRSLVAVPVRSGGKGIGVLFLDSSIANSFTDPDVEYVALLAGIIGAGHSHLHTLLELLWMPADDTEQPILDDLRHAVPKLPRQSLGKELDERVDAAISSTANGRTPMPRETFENDTPDGHAGARQKPRSVLNMIRRSVRPFAGNRRQNGDGRQGDDTPHRSDYEE